MPFKPHVRITALGRIGTRGVERFSFGVNMHAPVDDRIVGLTANQTVWDDVAADVAAFFARPATAISEVAVLEEVKVASIGADGKYTADPVIVNVPDTPGGNNSGQNLIPPQSALAVSLTTARRGSSGRGRFYLPLPVHGINADTLSIDEARAVGVRDSAVQFVTDLNNQPGIDVLGLQVCVASSKGYNSTVNGVRIGRVIDTVRSRRRSLDEAYTSVGGISTGD